MIGMDRSLRSGQIFKKPVKRVLERVSEPDRLVPGPGVTLTRTKDGLLISASDPWTYVVLSEDSIVSTMSDVRGMKFIGAANTAYEVEVFGAFQNAGIDFDIPSGTVSGLFGKFLIKMGTRPGPVQLRQRPEVDGSDAVLKAGLRMKYRVI